MALPRGRERSAALSKAAAPSEPRVAIRKRCWRGSTPRRLPPITWDRIHLGQARTSAGRWYCLWPHGRVVHSRTRIHGGPGLTVAYELFLIPRSAGRCSLPPGRRGESGPRRRTAGRCSGWSRPGPDRSQGQLQAGDGANVLVQVPVATADVVVMRSAVIVEVCHPDRTPHGDEMVELYALRPYLSVESISIKQKCLRRNLRLNLKRSLSGHGGTYLLS